MEGYCCKNGMCDDVTLPRWERQIMWDVLCANCGISRGSHRRAHPHEVSFTVKDTFCSAFVEPGSHKVITSSGKLVER